DMGDVGQPDLPLFLPRLDDERRRLGSDDDDGLRVDQVVEELSKIRNRIEQLGDQSRADERLLLFLLFLLLALVATIMGGFDKGRHDWALLARLRLIHREDAKTRRSTWRR